ncbi:MAG TPA: acyltransferase [Nevskiaceae bacterium]|nr:acyltransferase [Nevskiaceae bacterium]
MLSLLLPAPLAGAIAYFLLLGSTILAGGSILPVALIKLLVPIAPFRRACSRLAVWLAGFWPRTNRAIYSLIHPRRWRVEINGDIQRGRNYLLVCNHQSWTDILVLADVFSDKLPFPRFFLKHELLYVPLIGTGCWAMDFPFMKRHSREAVAANPALKGEDLEATRRACEIYKTQPVLVINFLEGTRFSEAKRAARQSPYRHLLRPKSAGLAFTLSAMGEQFAGIIDATIAYQPTTRRNILWSWLCGEQDTLTVHAEVLPVPAALLHGDYDGDAQFRAEFQSWVNALWAHKDAELDTLLQPAQAARRVARQF